MAISIHAPRTGSDEANIVRNIPTKDFNPRSPHGERLRSTRGRVQHKRFQSTLPARGATRFGSKIRQESSISIHAPRTGSDDFACAGFLRRLGISIHAPRTGSDGAEVCPAPAADISIHAPRTGSDPAASRARQRPAISIHAPRTGSDGIRLIVGRNTDHFNPRSPHGERPEPPARASSRQQFQSTLPARGATMQKRIKSFEQ